MPDPLKPGQEFGAYTIESPLGRGGMGAVYLATQARLGRKVALKVIAAELALDDEFRGRFLRESQLAASLDHPNVIPVYDADEIDGVLYLAMRYVRGPSLQDLLRNRGSLSPAETLRIAEQIGGALDAAHRAGLVHRDIKPANILIAEPDGHSYLCDFGLAKLTSSEGMTRTGSFLGTVDYCAPEQIQGLVLDGRADVYSLGCVLFHCLAGEAPYAGETEFAVLEAHLHREPPSLSAVRSDLPSTLDPVIARALAKEPDGRYASAGALATAFGKALGDAIHPEATRAAPAAAQRAETTRVAPRRPSRSRRRWIAGALAVVVLGGTAAGIVATRSDDDRSPSEAQLRTFVDRIENVLDQSAAGRSEIGAALAAGLDCSIAPREAGRRIASVADNRQSILGQLGTLEAPTQEAADAVTLLQQSLQHSIEADRHYRDAFYATSPGAGCPIPRNPSFQLAAGSDAEASAAKGRFVTAFDPLAERFERRTWTAGEF